MNAAPPNLTTRLQSIDRRMKNLQTRRDAEVDQVLSDLEWMDVPHLRLGRHWVDAEPAIGDDLHLVQSREENGGRVQVSGHRAEACNRPWCGKVGETRRSRYSRKGRGTKFTFLGTWRVLDAGTEYVLYDPSKLDRR